MNATDKIDWQVEQSTIAQRAIRTLRSELWTDCTFVVGNDSEKKFKAHKLILSMTSPVFERMFHHNNFHEKDTDVKIVDITPEAFGAMLKQVPLHTPINQMHLSSLVTWKMLFYSYVYSDEIKPQSFDQACELCYVANKYMMPNLLNQCTSYIWKDVNVSNACRGYEFAKLFDQNQLMDKCKTIIKHHTSEVIRHPSFKDVQLSTLQMILQEEELNLESELELFKVVELWAQAEFERTETMNGVTERQKAILDLVPKICFLSMTPTDFAEGPALSPLLTKDQAFAILMNITTRNCVCPMPSGFTMMVRRVPSPLEETNRMIYLKWNFEIISPIHNFSKSESSVIVCCSKNIHLYGVMVMSQLPCHSIQNYENGILFPSHHKYLEAFTSTFEDIAEDKIENVSYKGMVEYATPINVLFPLPLQMSRGRTYKISVKMNQSGLYTGGRLRNTDLVYKSVTFGFLKASEVMFIHGFIFG